MAQLTSKDVMTTEVQTVQEDTSLEEIAQLLATHHLSGVPVVDAERRVIGVVSEADLIDEDKRETQLPRMALFGVFPVPDDVLKNASRQGKMLLARNLMTKKVITATEAASVRELADLMIARKINRIPIVRDGRLVGIVSRGDLVRALAQGQEV